MNKREIRVSFYAAEDLGAEAYIAKLATPKTKKNIIQFPIGNEPMIRVHDFTVHLTLDLPKRYVDVIAEDLKVLSSFSRNLNKRFSSKAPNFVFSSYLTTFYDQVIGGILPISRSLSRASVKPVKKSAKISSLQNYFKTVSQSMHSKTGSAREMLLYHYPGSKNSP